MALLGEDGRRCIIPEASPKPPPKEGA